MRASTCGVVAAVLLGACKERPGASRDAGEVLQASAEWLEGRLPPEAIQGEPTRGGRLLFRVPTEPAGLNPLHDQFADSWTQRYTVGPVLETLAEMDRQSGELLPLLAESWTESDDHRTLTVKLRSNVRFHDGQVLTSQDVVAVLGAVVDPKNPTVTMRSYFTDLEKFFAPDPRTVVVRWKKPYFLASRNLLTGLPVFSAKSLEGDFNTLALNRSLVGTGPFRFVSWEPARSLAFERFEGYWGEQPYLDGFVARVVRDHAIATQLWERGEFDLMTMIPAAAWRGVERPSPENAWAVRGYHRVAFPENFYSWIGWNHERPFFADARVRRALTMLLPLDSVTKNVDLGLEVPTTCPYYRSSRSCDPSVERLPFSPSTAKALLAEAGWKDTNSDGVLDRDGLPFRFTFLATPYSVRTARIVPLLQEQMRKVGIEMDVEKVEPAVFQKRFREHQFDAGALAWSSRDLVQDNYQLFHSSQTEGGSNYVNFRDRETDRLLESIRTEFDPSRRAELERTLHRRVYDQQVYTFLTNRLALDAVRKRVRGATPSVGWYDLRRMWLHPG